MTKKVLFILMPKNYRDEEFYEPYNILKEKGFEIDVASSQPGEAVGANGHKHTPNLLLDQLEENQLDVYDALVIPGGPGSTKYLWKNKKIQEIVKVFNKNKKVVAAICYAVIALVESDILKNKKATVYPTDEAKEILKKHYVRFSEDGCVTLENEKIITAQGPSEAKEFGLQILTLLE